MKKAWFDSHRQEYDDYVLNPAKNFIHDMGQVLKKTSPNVIADPRVNKSLFRLNRDIRFSKDKTPYKTHLAIWFWEGTSKRMECSGFLCAFGAGSVDARHRYSYVSPGAFAGVSSFSC